MSSDNALNDYTNSHTFETLANIFYCQAEVFHIPETQVCVELKSHVLQGHELNSDKILAIKQFLEDG